MIPGSYINHLLFDSFSLIPPKVFSNSELIGIRWYRIWKQLLNNYKLKWCLWPNFSFQDWINWNLVLPTGALHIFYTQNYKSIGRHFFSRRHQLTLTVIIFDIEKEMGTHLNKITPFEIVDSDTYWILHKHIFLFRQ